MRVSKPCFVTTSQSHFSFSHRNVCGFGWFSTVMLDFSLLLSQVVEKIMAVEHRTRLLVVDRETDEFLRFHSLPCTEELAVEQGCLSPRASSLTSSPRTSCSSSPQVSLSPSLRDSITPPFSRGSSGDHRTAIAGRQIDKVALIMNGNKVRPPTALSDRPVFCGVTAGDTLNRFRPAIF